MVEITRGTDFDRAAVYRDLHAHPELSFQEHRTSALVADLLQSFGFATTTGVGRTGVVGLLHNGPGPVVLLRADMDALPVQEGTGLAFASTARGLDHTGQEVPVMHACGHDMHVTCLLGAASDLAADRTTWAGTLMVVFQPAEELGAGAQAMIDDGLFARFPAPDVVLGQHVAPIPACLIGLRAGTTFASSDPLRVRLFGRGAHGSRPEASVDPVLMAAATVMRLQGIVSREVGGTETAVVTVGALRAGTKENIIPDDAELLLSIRTFEEDVRMRVLAAVERIVRAEAAASGAPREPLIESLGAFPAVVNDPAAVARTKASFDAWLGHGRVVDPGPVTGSEDVGLLARASGAPCSFWILGGADPALFEGATSVADIVMVMRGLPSNHSPQYAPVIEPTMTMGVTALTRAAQAWMPPTT